MKILKTGFFIVFALLLCNKLISQSNTYIDFFDNKYFFEKGILKTIDNKIILISQKDKNKFTFCGKNILKKEIIRYTNYNVDSVQFIKSSKHFISNIHYKLMDCVDFYDVIDSIQIEELKNECNFSIFQNGTEQTIFGFTIIGDSLNYEIEYTNFNLNKKNTDSKAKEYLLKIINDNMNCSKFVIKDIYFYNFKEKSKFYLGIEILLIQ